MSVFAESDIVRGGLRQRRRLARPGMRLDRRHLPGQGRGDGYVRRRQELADGTFEIAVEDVLANDHHGLVIASGRATRRGVVHEWRAHGLCRFEGGRIAECWVLPEDQLRFDEIWS